jgi:P27 family predicted phage terminase small subunit
MARPGRKPKPSEIRKLEGNRGNRPIPETVKPDRGDRPPEPPSHLSADAKAEWKRVSRGLWDLGLLTPIDVGALAAYCQAWGRWRTAERLMDKAKKAYPAGGGLYVETSNGNLVQHPAVSIANRAMTDLVKYAAEFGMTPSGRTKVPQHVPTSPRAGQPAPPPAAASEPDEKPNYFN